MATSGTTAWNPSLAEIIFDSYERLGKDPSSLEQRHLVSARRSLNFILQDWSANRGGPNLWAVDLIYLPLVPGQSTYVLPSDTVNLLDAFLRQAQMSSSPNAASIGNALMPLLNFNGTPMLSNLGIPLLISLGSGTFTTTAGSQTVQMYWPSHGQVSGNIVYFPIPMIAGPLTIPASIAVDQVIDANNFTFLVNTPALQSGSNLGETPLFGTTNASGSVTVYLYNHGYLVGGSFATQVQVSVGGLTIPVGTYTVTTVPNSYSFTITPGGTATSSTCVFENSGQFQITEMQSGVNPTDYIMWGISRTEYASLPNKPLQGRPTTFWLDRVNPPQITIWEVPPTPQNGGPVTQPFALGLYRMRQIQDANPINGQTADMPVRAVKALASALTAELALKFAAERYPMLAQIAAQDWERLSTEDVERVPLFISPGLDSYYSN